MIDRLIALGLAGAIIAMMIVLAIHVMPQIHAAMF